MVEDRFMMVSLDDPKMKSLSEVLGNKTCKKIIDYLAENKQASQKDLSEALDLSMSKLDYNIKKLIQSGLIQKRKNFFWSTKGKKIVMYELSNKSIVISPKKSNTEKLKSILPGFIVVGVGSFVAWVYGKINSIQYLQKDSVQVLEKGVATMDSIPTSNELFGAGSEVARISTENAVQAASVPTSPLWLWFLAGGLLALFIFSIVNWRKL